MSNDGGPAFPDPPIEHAGYWYSGTSGMSLLDYFAGQALVGILASSPDILTHTAAQWAYDQAGAMIEHKQKRDTLAAESQQVALGIGGEK